MEHIAITIEHWVHIC